MSRKRGWLWMVMGVALAFLAAIMVYRVVSASSGQTAAPPTKTQSVIVATQDIPRGTVIDKTMVTVRDVPAELVPVGAATTLDDVVEKMVVVDIKRGEILLRDRLETPTNVTRNFGLVIPHGKVLIALPADDLINRVGVLQPGDKVDILFSLNYGQGNPTEMVTLDALQDIAIQAVVMPPEARIAQKVAGQLGAQGQQTLQQASGAFQRAILVAVDPQDALLIKYLKDTGAVLDFALRAPDDTSKPLLDAVTLKYLIDTYGLDIPLPTGTFTVPTGTRPGGP